MKLNVMMKVCRAVYLQLGSKEQVKELEIPDTVREELEVFLGTVVSRCNTPQLYNGCYTTLMFQ